MRWRLLKIIFKDQAVSTNLNLVVAVWRGCILDTELEFDRHRASIGQLHNIVGFAYYRILARGERLTLPIGVFVDKLPWRKTQPASAFLDETLTLISPLVQ
jgi:hypothetical protein